MIVTDDVAVVNTTINNTTIGATTASATGAFIGTVMRIQATANVQVIRSM